MNLDVFLDTYSLERTITKATIEQYRIAINTFSKWLGKPVQTADLTDESINRFLLAYGQQRKPHTVASKRRQLLVLWRAIAERGEAQPPARVRRIKTPPTPKDVWTAEEVVAICQNLSRLKGRLPIVLIRPGDYYVSLIRAAWETGLRLSDLMGLERQQIERSGWFSVVMQKTGLPQWCRLHSSTYDIIQRTFDDIAPPRRLCWPTWSTRTPKAGFKLVRRDIMRAVREAGLSCSDGPFKKLRRSSITAVELLSPGQGQYHAGHTSVNTTQKWYLSESAKLNRPIPAELV